MLRRSGSRSARPVDGCFCFASSLMNFTLTSAIHSGILAIGLPVSEQTTSRTSKSGFTHLSRTPSRRSWHPGDIAAHWRLRATGLRLHLPLRRACRMETTPVDRHDDPGAEIDQRSLRIDRLTRLCQEPVTGGKTRPG